MATASNTDLVGMSCRLIATSPKARSRSMSSVLAPVLARYVATLVDRVVLPTPPLAENTVTTLPSRPPSRPACPMRRAVRSRLRRSASTSAVWSSAVTTSRTPLRSAWESAVTSTRWRRRMTPSSGPVESGRLRQLAGLVEQDLRTDDHLLDAEVLVQGTGHHGGGVERLGVRHRARSGIAPGRWDQHPRGCSLDLPSSIVRSLTESSGLTLSSGPRRPAYST